MSPIIFATQKYQYLAQEMATLLGTTLGQKTVKNFPDGERYMQIHESVINQSVVIVGSTVSDEDTLEIYDLACACVKYGASRLTLVIPYFGYGTMERATKIGEIVPAKTRARLLSSIPKCSQGNKVLLMDLHSEGIPYYFENDIQVFHLYAKPVLIDIMKTIAPHNDFVLAATDAGRAKWVESLAKELGVQPAFVYKQRLSGSQTQVTGVNAQVTGKTVIIYDDMIRTGSSLLGAAQAYLNAGAKEVYALTTHGVFPGNALQKLQTSGLIKEVYCTNTHLNGLALQNNCKSVAQIFTDFIQQYC
jgi:ribose-phosphate pyrophosphokinase